MVKDFFLLRGCPALPYIAVRFETYKGVECETLTSIKMCVFTDSVSLFLLLPLILIMSFYILYMSVCAGGVSGVL